MNNKHTNYNSKCVYNLERENGSGKNSVKKSEYHAICLLSKGGCAIISMCKKQVDYGLYIGLS